MSLSRDDVKKLRADLLPLLKELESKIGFSLKLGNAKYTGEVCVFKLDCGRIGEGGTSENQESQDFKMYCTRYGLKAEDFGRKFVYAGKVYEICGLKTRATKAPILCKRSDGKIFKFVTETVRGRLASGQTEVQPVKRSESAIIRDLQRVERELSPESLSCDGELPVWKVKIAESKLQNEKRNLVAELGRAPTHDELYPDLDGLIE